MRNLWLAPADRIEEARPLTRFTDRPMMGHFVWAWTSRHIIYFRDHHGDENFHACSIDIETGRTLALCPEHGVRSFVQQRSPKFPTEILLAHNARDRRYFDLYRVDVSTGTCRLAFENQVFAHLHTDRNLDLRFSVKVHPDASAEYFERRSDGSWSSFFELKPEDASTTRICALSADGRFAFLIDSRGRDKAALTEIDLLARSRRVLAEDDESDIADVVVSPETDTPMAAVSITARRRWHVIDPSFGEDLRHLQAASPGEIHIISESSDGKGLVAFIDRDDAPGAFVLYDRRAGSSKPLFKARPSLDGAPLRPMKPVQIRARDGLRLTSYLTLPSDDSREAPMVLTVHGGPYERDLWGYNGLHQWLANRGYAVLSVNFRGSTGFGKAFLRAADGEWGRRMQDDLIDGVDWAVREGYADKDRVGILGGSYGGYAALMAATQTPEMFACIVDICGPANLATFMKAVPSYWTSWFAIWKQRLADPFTEAGQAWLRKRSPLAYVDCIKRPILIAHGMNDVRVSSNESEEIVASMQRRRLPVTYVAFPDEGHGLRGAENRIALCAVIENFLSKHLGGRMEAPGDDLAKSSLRIEAGRQLITPFG